MQMPIERQEAVKKGIIEIERDKLQQIEDIKQHGTLKRDAAGNFTPELRQAVKALQGDIRDQQALIQELQEWGKEYAHIATEALQEVYSK